MGHSAGAHLAASLVTELAPGPTRDLVAGLLLVGGIYDLPPLAESYVNERVGMGAQEAVALANEHYIAAQYALNVAKAVFAHSLGTAEDAARQYLGGIR